MGDLIVNDRLAIPARELRVSFARSGGPGGQNVNKVESKAELRWTPADSEALPLADREWLLVRLGPKLTASGELIVTSSRTRDQLRNREDAEAKLVQVVRAALRRPKTRRKTKPKAGAIERRLEGKQRRGRIKKDRQARDENL